MKRKRFNKKQIISILKEREAGMKVAELARKHGVSEQSIYRWQSKYGSEEVSKAREREAGMKVPEPGRRHGVSKQSIYRWQSKYGGREISDAKRMELLEEENRRLKRMVADLSLDKQMLEDIIKMSKVR